MIKDSGNRRTFSTGSVRDIQEGKGRCDLMPLEVVANILHPGGLIMGEISLFKTNRDSQHLYRALKAFAQIAYGGSQETMLLDVAVHYEEGAKKYGENNWQKGIPASSYLNSAIRHYLKWRRGDNDEPHDKAFVWNLMCCIWEVDHRAKN